jgi:SPX domain protein involved in polyphosphate accumulation
MRAPAPEPQFDVLIGMVAGAAPPQGVYGCRAERKLVLEPGVAAELRAVVAAHLPLEEWVPGRRRTRIHSIYFDTPDFALYRRSVATGDAASLKLRVRAYGGADGRLDVPFLEAKVGVTAGGHRLKRKTRMRLGPQKLARLFGRGSRPVTRRKAWRPVLAELAALGLRPCLTVSYDREAFQDAAGALRVTFDEGYHASPLLGVATPLAGPAGRLDGRVVVEIKLAEGLPAWLEAALARLGLPAEGQAFSKFKTAVALLYPQEI